jgi:hypothetical protein
MIFAQKYYFKGGKSPLFLKKRPCSELLERGRNRSQRDTRRELDFCFNQTSLGPKAMATIGIRLV